ncbi:MAG: prepilin-type N-terminal cleavage/methylation domain-containing protein [Opitutaceae bacterium]|jgi:prepilin-type N-terminal cleavage/methylation domain-containing protein|nr:prepilin-type N-terminal cleavage/methylation domain-containing protein [Opitutaceae bacterium]
MNSNRPSKPSGLRAFTLIELLTVIAIIGILAAIIIPTVGNVRKAAQSTRALNNAKQIGMATLLYAQDNRGQILGHNDNVFADTEFMFRMWVKYLQKTPGGNVELTANTMKEFVDPLVPEEFQLYVNYPYTWAINRIFSLRGGRSAQGVSAVYGTGKAPRLLNEFMEPSRTLYAVSGTFEITAANVVDASKLNPPTQRSGQGIFYYHRNGRATPGVFLDGHTQMLSFPIDPTLTKLKEFN